MTSRRDGSIPPAQPPAIGGWLSVLGLGMAIGPIATAASAYDSYTSTTISPSASIRSALQVEAFLLSGLAMFHIYVAIEFFRRSRAAPVLVISLLFARVIFNVIDLGMSSVATPALDNVIGSTIVAGIWTMYLKRSKRVKATFIVGRPAEDVDSPPQPAEPRRAAAAVSGAAPVPIALYNAVAVFDPWTIPQPALAEAKAASASPVRRQVATCEPTPAGPAGLLAVNDGAPHADCQIKRSTVADEPIASEPAGVAQARWFGRTVVCVLAVIVPALALAVGYGLLTSGATASRSALTPDGVFANCSPAVVQVETLDRQGRVVGSGSGFLVGRPGLIATNYHVIDKAHAAHVVFSDRTSAPVEGVAALDRDADLAILRTAGRASAQPLELAGDGLPPVGAKVYAIGNPLGEFANTLSDGLISGHRERGTVPLFPNMPTMIQTTAPTSHGSSGGPLVGADGRVVGVMTLTWEDVGGRNVNLAVPASNVARLLGQCESGGSLTRLPLVREPDASDYIKSGDAWGKKGDHDKAITEYTEAIRLEPGGAFAYWKRGNAWYLKREYRRAIADFDQAIRLDPNDARYHAFRGDAWADSKEMGRAIRDFDQAIRLDPKYAYAYSCRASVWIEKKEYDRAIEDLTEAVRLSRGDPSYFQKRLAFAYYMRGETSVSNAPSAGPERIRESWRKAVADYSEAIRLDPDNAAYHRSRGNTRSLLAIGSGRRANYDLAMQDFEEAIRLDPNDHFAYGGRAQIWLDTGEYDRAIWGFNEAIRLEPSYALNYSGRGDARLAKRNYDQALRDYDQAIRLDPAMAQIVDHNRRIAWSRKMGR